MQDVFWIAVVVAVVAYMNLQCVRAACVAKGIEGDVGGMT
jgi:hypothetical protein